MTYLEAFRLGLRDFGSAVGRPEDAISIFLSGEPIIKLKEKTPERREKRKAVQSGCIKSPPLKKIKAYNERIGNYERDHVKVSKAKKLVNQGVLDPGFILQLQHTAHKASYPVGVYREDGGGIQKRAGQTPLLYWTADSLRLSLRIPAEYRPIYPRLPLQYSLLQDRREPQVHLRCSC
ncbi:hypothetical protein AAMO2058_000138600 [Amorphochlora amoebiformis]